MLHYSLLQSLSLYLSLSHLLFFCAAKLNYIIIIVIISANKEQLADTTEDEEGERERSKIVVKTDSIRIHNTHPKAVYQS